MFSITPATSVPTSFPDQQHSSQLHDAFSSAESCLQERSFRNCYEYLANVIKLDMFIAMGPDAAERFFTITHQLQMALFKEQKYDELYSLICVEHKSLVRLLIVSPQKVMTQPS